MKRLSVCAALLALIFIIPPAAAQTRPKNDVDITITKLHVRKETQKDIYPPLRGFVADRKSDWIWILVEYRIDPKKKKRDPNTGRYKKKVPDMEADWVDELTFHWKVILPLENASKRLSEKVSIRMTRTVRYGNVELGKKKYAMIFIEPHIYERYRSALTRDLIYIYLQVQIGGKTKTKMWAKNEKFEISPKYPPRLFPPTLARGSWFESEEIKTLNYGLLNKLETPWSKSSWRDVEFIIPASGGGR